MQGGIDTFWVFCSCSDALGVGTAGADTQRNVLTGNEMAKLHIYISDLSTQQLQKISTIKIEFLD